MKFLLPYRKYLLLLILALIFIPDAYFVVEQGERAVLTRFGKLENVYAPGFHLKIPIIDSVKKMSVRTQKFTKKLEIYSKDVQAADVLLSVNYSLDPSAVADIYTKIGMNYQERVIQPQLISKPKDIFGQFNAVNIVQMREQVTKGITDELVKYFSKTGINILSVQIENIDFSDSYEHSVEERMKAEVEVQKVKQNLEREKLSADMNRVKAQGEADAKLARAEAEAKAIITLSKAEAEAIKVKNQALSQNPLYIQLIQAEKWDGKLPNTILPSQALPVLNLK